VSLKYAKEDTSSSEQDKGAEGRSKFVKTDSDSAKMLQSVEEAFDDISEFIELRIKGSLLQPIAPWRDDRDAIVREDILNNVIAVITTISKDEGVFQVNGFQERHGIWRIMLLPWGKEEPADKTVSIHQRVDLGG
jgi:hypothetical protein